MGQKPEKKKKSLPLHDLIDESMKKATRWIPPPHRGGVCPVPGKLLFLVECFVPTSKWGFICTILLFHSPYQKNGKFFGGSKETAALRWSLRKFFSAAGASNPPGTALRERRGRGGQSWTTLPKGRDTHSAPTTGDVCPATGGVLGQSFDQKRCPPGDRSEKKEPPLKCPQTGRSGPTKT